MTQWYVLQVLTGQEEDVQQELERHGYETLLLREMQHDPSAWELAGAGIPADARLPLCPP